MLEFNDGREDEDDVDDEDARGQATCEEGDFLPFIVAVSVYMAQAVQAFILDGSKASFHVHSGRVRRI